VAAAVSAEPLRTGKSGAAASGGVEQLTKGVLAHTPMARFGELPEVPGAAIFLASPAASFVTGHTLCVDGGWTAS
jgi:NAD(P)-dependent dehydrogenase (short-subunit alcohol dehydrogenase family)